MALRLTAGSVHTLTRHEHVPGGDLQNPCEQTHKSGDKMWWWGSVGTDPNVVPLSAWPVLVPADNLSYVDVRILERGGRRSR